MDTNEPVSEAGQLLEPARGQPEKHARKRTIVIFIIASLLNVGLLVLLFTQLLTPTRSASQNTNTTSNSNDPLVGQTAPAFTLTVLNGSSGQKISLADFKGKPIVINFWNSACVPCKDEAPLLETQWQRLQAQDVVFLGIDLEDSPDVGLQFLQQHGLTYPSVLDTNGRTTVDYGVTYTPETIFIDRAGRVASAIRQEISARQFQQDLQTILR